MKSIRRICAVLTGMVLFGAGLLKLMDPVGASLVAGEYFNFLGLSFMVPLAMAVGVGMALLETVLGAGLITGVWPRLVAAASGVVLGGFTVLTLVMWIVNPAMDCGCFGEAVHLTHKQSFLKNVVLCVLWAVACLPFRSIRKPLKVKYVSFWIATVSVAAFSVWAMLNIPPMDFTPLKPGAMLMQAEQTPSEDAPLLSICDASGEYRDEILARGAFLLVSVYDPDALPKELEGEIYALSESLRGSGIIPLVLRSYGESENVQSFNSDRRTLLTLNRSNGGATLLSDGIVIAKWSRRDYPSPASLQDLLSQDPTDAVLKENTPKRLKLQGFLLYVFAVLLLL